METFSPKERSLNFGKEEKERFKDLINKYKTVLFNKKTDSANNFQKKRVWNAIHSEFNALSNNPRTIKQLQAKFDNMKRNARKDASKQRQELFKTGGGPPPPPSDADTDWLRNVMPISMDGLPSKVDDDSQISVQETEDIPELLPISNKMDEYLQKAEIENANKKNMIDQKEISILEMEKIIQTNDHSMEAFNTKSPASLLRTPVSRSLKVNKKRRLSEYVPSGSKSTDSLVNTERLELFRDCRKYEKEIFELRVQHLNEKRKEDEIIFKLKEKKILLEISLLERNLQK